MLSEHFIGPKTQLALNVKFVYKETCADAWVSLQAIPSAMAILQ